MQLCEFDNYGKILFEHFNWFFVEIPEISMHPVVFTKVVPDTTAIIIRTENQLIACLVQQ